jgi:taurine dioxygenase
MPAEAQLPGSRSGASPPEIRAAFNTGRTRAIHPRFGLEVAGVDLTDLEPRTIEALRLLLVRNGVLLFRDQDLLEEQLEMFSRQIGDGRLEMSARKMAHSRSRPYVAQLTNMTRSDTGEAMGFGGSTTDFWHSDQEFRETPATLATLYCKVPSPVGGQTSFASTLVRNLDLDSRTLAHIHHLWSTRIPAPSHDNVQHVEVRHPVLLTSPLDGREFVYHSENTRAFIGLDEESSGALKKQLLEGILSPANVYSHDWKAGDLLLYDNTQVVHRREAFQGERWLQATKIFADPEIFVCPAGARYDAV